MIFQDGFSTVISGISWDFAPSFFRNFEISLVFRFPPEISLMLLLVITSRFVFLDISQLDLGTICGRDHGTNSTRNSPGTFSKKRTKKLRGPLQEILETFEKLREELHEKISKSSCSNPKKELQLQIYSEISLKIPSRGF